MEQNSEKNQQNTLTTKKKRIMIYFIEATEKLIHEEGIDGLSIRKIATEAGYNSATIYNYFEDLEHLILFASVRYLREYVISLSEYIKPNMNALERYKAIYDCFNEYAFRSPDIFDNMFFGKYRYRLTSVLRTYYIELFPEELNGLTNEMIRVLLEGNMLMRDNFILESLIKEGFIDSKKASITSELIVAVFQSYLHEAYLLGEKLEISVHKKKFNYIFEYILKAGK